MKKHISDISIKKSLPFEYLFYVTNMDTDLNHFNVVSPGDNITETPTDITDPIDRVSSEPSQISSITEDNETDQGEQQIKENLISVIRLYENCTYNKKKFDNYRDLFTDLHNKNSEELEEILKKLKAIICEANSSNMLLQTETFSFGLIEKITSKFTQKLNGLEFVLSRNETFMQSLEICNLLYISPYLQNRLNPEVQLIQSFVTCVGSLYMLNQNQPDLIPKLLEAEKKLALTSPGSIREQAQKVNQPVTKSEDPKQKYDTL